MLARYLRTQQTPRVRYTINTRDPALMEAIRNFLGIRLRGSELPAQTQTNPEIAGLHQQHPILGHAFNTLLQSGHPGDLMAYLDLLNDTGAMSSPTAQPFTRSLESAANYVNTQAYHPEIMQLFGQPAVEHPSLRQAVGRNMPPTLGNSVYDLAQTFPSGYPLQGSLQAVLRTLFTGDGNPRLGNHPGAVPALLRAHDVGHAAALNMQDLGHTLPQVRPQNRADIPGRALRTSASDTLRRVVWPHLAHATPRDLQERGLLGGS